MSTETPSFRSHIPVLTTFVLATACARTGDIERADPDTGRGPETGGPDADGPSDAGTDPSDAGVDPTDTIVLPETGDDVIRPPDAGSGIDGLVAAITDYCVGLRQCDPEWFAGRFGPGTSGCERAFVEQVSSYYEQGVFSPGCVDAYREAIRCTVETGYCAEYYDDYGERIVGLRPSYDCIDEFERFETECGFSDDGYGDGDGGFEP